MSITGNRGNFEKGKGVLKIVREEINPEMRQPVEEITMEEDRLISISPFSLTYIMLTTFTLGSLIGFNVSLDKERYRVEENNVDKIIRKYDSNNDGHLNVSEFEAYLKNR